MNIYKKILSIILCFVMLFSGRGPMSVYANDITPSVETTQAQTRAKTTTSAATEISTTAINKPLQLLEHPFSDDGTHILGQPLKLVFNQEVELKASNSEMWSAICNEVNCSPKETSVIFHSELSGMITGDYLKINPENPCEVLITADDFIKDYGYSVGFDGSRIHSKSTGEPFWQPNDMNVTDIWNLNVVAPSLQLLSSTFDVDQVYIDLPIKMLFDEAVSITKGTDERFAGKGNVVIEKNDGSEIYGDYLRINPDNDHEVLLDIGTLLDFNERYKISIDGSAIENQYGVLYVAKTTDSRLINLKFEAHKSSGDLKLIYSSFENGLHELPGQLKWVFNQPVELVESDGKFESQYSIEDVNVVFYCNEDDVKMGKYLSINPDNDCEVLINIDDFLEPNKNYSVMINPSIIQSVATKERLSSGDNLDYYFFLETQEAGSVDLALKTKFHKNDAQYNNFISAVMHNGMVYAIRDYISDTSLDSAKLFIFDLYGNIICEKIFSDALSENVKTTPTFDDDGNIYIEMPARINSKVANKMHVLSFTATGELRWERFIDGKTDFRSIDTVVTDGSVFIGTNNGIVALSSKNGDILWEYTKTVDGRQCYHFMMDEKGHLISAYGNSNSEMNLECVSSQGELLWTTEAMSLLAYKVNYSVLDSNDQLIVATNKGILYVLNPQTGEFSNDAYFNGYDLKTSPLKLQLDNDKITDFNAIIPGLNGTLFITINGNKIRQLLSITEGKGVNYHRKYEESTYDDFLNLATSDEENYAYYSKNSSNLAGNYGIYVLNKQGQIDSKITIPGSSQAEPNDIKIYDDILIAPINHIAEVYIARIKREKELNPDKIVLVNNELELGINIEEAIPFKILDKKGNVLLADEYQLKSNTPTIAKVTEDNKVIGLTEGVADLKLAATIDGNTIEKTFSLPIIKKAPIANSLEIVIEDPKYDIDNLIIEASVPVQLKAIVRDQYGMVIASEKVWWSSLVNYAESMDQNGVFLTDKESTFEIVATLKSNNTIKCTITGQTKKNEPSFTDFRPKKLSMREGVSQEIIPLDQYGEPIILENGKFTYEIADEKIARISGNTVRARACGKTTITVSYADINGETTVIKKPIEIVPSFGLASDKNYNHIKDIQIDSDGIIFLADSQKIMSITSNHEVIWEQSFENIKSILLNDNAVFILIEDSNELLKLNKSNGETLWKKTLKSSSGELYTTYKGILYDATGKLDCYALEDGDKQWTYDYSQNSSSIENLQVDDEEIVLVTIDMNYSIYKRIKLSLDGHIKSEKLLYDKIYDKKSVYMQAIGDTNDVDLFYIRDNSYYDIACVEDNQVSWRYTLPIHQKPKGKFISDQEHLVVIADGLKDVTLYCFDYDGTLLWTNNLNDYVSEGIFKANEDYNIKDNTIYISGSRYDNKAYGEQASESYYFSFDAETGVLLQELNFDYQLYKERMKTFLIEDGFYSLTYHHEMNKNYLLHITHDATSNNYPKTIDIDIWKRSLFIGEKLKATAIIKNNIGLTIDDEAVIFSSSDENIFTVDENGNIIGKSPGNAKLQAHVASRKDVFNSIEITVINGEQYRLSPDLINKQLTETVKYYQQKGLPDSDWIAIALNAAGENINEAPYQLNNKTYADILEENIFANGDLGSLTNYARITLAILASQKDPHTIADNNLIEAISNYPNFNQGNNAPIWALIALNAVNDNDSIDQVAKNKLINYLLNHKAGKGWTWAGSVPDCDMTGMAIYALAPFYNKRDDVKQSIDEAVEWLVTVQHENGSFSPSGQNKYDGTVNTESTAQVIMGLVSIGLDPQSPPFIRANGNPLTALLKNRMQDGSFGHVDNKRTDGLATNQALQALSALNKYYESDKTNGNIFYDMPYVKTPPMPEKSLKLNVENTIENYAKYSFDDKFSVIFKKDSLSQEGSILVREVAGIGQPKGKNIKQNGSIVNFELVDTTLRKSAKLKFNLTNKALLSNSSIYGYDENTKTWHHVSSDIENGALIATVNHFSIYGVFANLSNPGGVKILAKEATANDITLKFVSENPSQVKYYEIYKNDFTKSYARTSEDFFIDTDVSPGKSYVYKVKIADLNGKLSDFSQSIIVTPSKNSNNNDDNTTPNGIPVYIRVVGYEGDIIPKKLIYVTNENLTPYLGAADGTSATPSNGWDIDKFKNGPSHAHAIVKALKNQHISFDLQDYGWSLYMAMIDGEREKDLLATSGWMYDVNGSMPGVGSNARTLNEYDEVTWFFSAYGHDHLFPSLKLSKKKIKSEDGVIVTLKDIRSRKAIKDAVIMINGEKSPYRTNEKGQATLFFDKDDYYTISAYHKKNGIYDMIHPEAVTLQVGNPKSGGSSGSSSGISPKPTKPPINTQYTTEYAVLRKESTNETQVVDTLDNVRNIVYGRMLKANTPERAIALSNDAMDAAELVKWTIDKIETPEAAEQTMKYTNDLMTSVAKVTTVLTVSNENNKDTTEKILKASKANTDNAFKTLNILADKTEDPEILKTLVDDFSLNVNTIRKNISFEDSLTLDAMMTSSAQDFLNETNHVTSETREDGFIALFNASNFIDLENINQKSTSIANELLTATGTKVIKTPVPTIMLNVKTNQTDQVITYIDKPSLDDINILKASPVKINTPIGSIELPKEVRETAFGTQIKVEIKRISREEQNDTLKAFIKNDSQVMDLNISVNQIPQSNFKEAIQVSIPYESSLDNAHKLLVYYQNENDQFEKIAGVYDAKSQMVTFKTTHLSTFFVKD